MSFDIHGEQEASERIQELIKIGKNLAQKYEIVITNPPYMGASGMTAKLASRVKDLYPDSKTDMFAVFIERCKLFMCKFGYEAMITQHSWMFIASYEKLRRKIHNTNLVNMIHLGARAFEEIAGEVVQTTSFVFCNSIIDEYSGKYCRLINFTSQKSKENAFLEGKEQYSAKQKDFLRIAGAPLAYWVPKSALSTFGNELIGDVASASVGIQTGDNNKFLQLWWEVEHCNIKFDAEKVEDSFQSKKWFPYNKGGEYRKWYGNDFSVVDWRNDGENIKLSSERTGHHYQQYADSFKFKKLITWSRISTGVPSFRLKQIGFLSDMAGFSLFAKDDVLDYLLAYCNSKVVAYYLDFLAPTLNIMTGSVLALPYCEDSRAMIKMLTDECVSLAKQDWDSFDVSWDFEKHPFLNGDREGTLISDKYREWEKACDGRFLKLKANEEELNRIFIDIYGLQDELTPEVDDKDVTVRRAELQRDIKSLVSYAVGCMFGRYSLDVEGLAYAGGEWDASKYSSFIPDDDNVIPITDEEYLEDDIVTRFCEFLKVVYGEDTLEENLDFIAKALGNKGDTSRTVIRNYFLTDFFKDHCQTYSVAGSGKRPIYWLFDSGKQNGFKALVYLHRYNADTIGNLRIEYLHKMQRVYESEINRMQDMIDHSTNSREVAVATKRKEKLTKQLKECRDYDEKIGHLALERIELDLDDGVKYNYRKVQTGNDGKFYEVLAESKAIMMDFKKYAEFKK
jgi:hypothetical protein